MDSAWMDTETLRAWIDERAAAGAFSGVVLLWADGRPRFEHAAGLAHRGHAVPVRTDTRFHVTSVTKMLTAVAALQLVEAGEVALATPLTEVLRTEHQPLALTPGHTLHHLLCHMSGLADYHDGEDESWASWVSCWDRIPTYHIREVADMLPLFKDLPARFSPGERFGWADANYILIGLVIEAVTGLRYHDVVADRVLGPASMADTEFTALDFDPARLALGYATSDRPAEKGRSNVYALPAIGMPDGGIITTAGDLARFLDALTAGALVSPPTLDLMLTPNAPIRGTDGLECYGYGMELTVVDERVTIIGHSGGDPGVNAMAWHFMDTASSLIVLSNQDAGSWAVSQRVANAGGLPDPRT